MSAPATPLAPREKLAGKLESAPLSIREAALRVLTLDESLQHARDDLRAIDTATRALVSASVDASGKKMYSNEDQRAAAVARTLADDPKYTELSAIEKSLQHTLAEARITLEYEQNAFRASRSIAALLAGGESHV